MSTRHIPKTCEYCHARLLRIEGWHPLLFPQLRPASTPTTRQGSRMSVAYCRRCDNPFIPFQSHLYCPACLVDRTNK